MQILSRYWRPALFLLLGLGTILASHYLLDTCGDHDMLLKTASGAQVPMRCSWTERGVQGVGGLVALLGLAMLIAPESWRGLSLAAAGAGVLMVLIPLWLIPTCATATMVCNLEFAPGALLLGGVVTLAGLIAMVRFQRLDPAEGA